MSFYWAGNITGIHAAGVLLVDLLTLWLVSSTATERTSGNVSLPFTAACLDTNNQHITVRTSQLEHTVRLNLNTLKPVCMWGTHETQVFCLTCFLLKG